MPVSLGGVLNLARMDRVQVLSQRTVREARSGSFVRPGTLVRREYPYWFFHCVDASGRLVVRSPGGYMEKVDPLDICDVQAGTPLRVMAVPRAVFLARSKCPVKLPGGRRFDEASDFEWATVMMVSKDRWARIDRVHVLFDDASLNEGDQWQTWSSLVRDQDVVMLNQCARRTILPVIGGRCIAGFSADHGLAAAERKHAREVHGFIRKRLVVRKAHQESGQWSSAVTGARAIAAEYRKKDQSWT